MKHTFRLAEEEAAELRMLLRDKEAAEGMLFKPPAALEIKRSGMPSQGLSRKVKASDGSANVKRGNVVEAEGPRRGGGGCWLTIG